MTDPQVMARLTAGVAEVAAQAADSAEPQPVRMARKQLEQTRHRLIETAAELRGIDCDFDTIHRRSDDHPAVEAAARCLPRDDSDGDMQTALVAVVDMITALERAVTRLAEWKPEEVAE